VDDGLIVFVVLLLLAVLLAGVVSFFLVLGARSRLAVIERRAVGTGNADYARLMARIDALERCLASQERPGATEEQPTAEAVPLVADPPAADIAAAPPAPPRTRPDLETALGTRWTVWVGGLALALGGLFLVRYSIEQGLLGPLARVVSGGIFAALLLAAGDYLRRKGAEPQGPASPLVSIPGIITAAGTMTAFASVYAAYALYGLLDPPAAFLLLGIVAVATMLASMLHGPALAALGLVGALTVPALVGGGSDDLWPVVAYFAAVSFASLALARIRRWKWLAIANVAGAMVWAVLFSEASPMLPADHAHIAVQFALAALFLIAEPFRRTPDEAAWPDRFAHAVVLGFAAVALFVIMRDFGPASRFAGLMVVLNLAAGLCFAPSAGATLLAGIIALATLFLWPDMVPAIADGGTGRPPPSLPLATQQFLLFALIAALAVTIGAGSRLWRGRMLPLVTAALYATAAAATPLLAILIAWWRVENFGLSSSFALVAAALAAAFALAAGLFLRQADPRTAPFALAAEAFAAAAIAGLALGLTIGFEKAGLTLSLSLAAAGSAWVTTRGPLNSLRAAVGALGLAVLGRIAWDPSVIGGDLGPIPIFNWLLLGYGMPTLAFFLAGRLLRQRSEDWALRLCEGLTVLFATLLVLFEIRHFVNGGDILAPVISHLELGLDLTVALAFSTILMRLDAGRPNPVYRIASFAFGLISLPLGVFGLGLVHNPLVEGKVSSGSLLIGYAAPALAALVLAWLATPRRPLWFTQTIAAFGFLMLFGFVTLETRHIFQGADITYARGFANAELWAYSAVWLAMGIGLLAAGLISGSRLLRIVSAVLILITTAKAFLIDMSGLQGFWRAASFIGLGFVLIGIGLIYQRLLVSKPAADTGGK
jgi:uncharacterized membrane protein